MQSLKTISPRASSITCFSYGHTSLLRLRQRLARHGTKFVLKNGYLESA